MLLKGDGLKSAGVINGRHVYGCKMEAWCLGKHFEGFGF